MRQEELDYLLENGAATGDERCGVVYGLVIGEEAWVAGSVQLGNVAADPAHNYEFDPEQQARIWHRVDQNGYEVLAIWHTHPEGPTGPSTTDVAFAQPWLLYPVLSPGVVQVCRFTADGYEVVPYEVNPDAVTVAETERDRRANA